MMNDSINDYRLLGLIGEGAFGKVYKAVGVDRKEYALKIIPISPKVKDKIREEGRLLASMQHHNILWAREFFYYQQQRYFVIITEFCNNGGLDNYIGTLNMEKTLSIMKGIAQGLLYLHNEKQIVHRDLKPENILLNDWVPKIADMGVAKMLKTYQVSTKIGTPTYMAFQMFEGDYSIEVDVWALGIIYIEMLLGKRIYKLIKGEEIPAKRATFPSEDLLKQIADDKMRKMVREMLKKNPKERITIEQVLGYFDMTQFRVSKGIMAFSDRKRKEEYSQIIADCYLKTQDYWYNKYPFSFIKQVYEKNMVEIVTEAQSNNKKALFLQAKMYQQGIGMLKSAEKAEQLFLRCYEQQEPHSCYELYLLGTSNAEKFRYLMSGKELEEVRCLYKLAQDYLQGKQGLCIDYQQAQEIIEFLCKKQYPSAYFLKGTLHSKKNTQYSNHELMKQAFKKGADLGHLQCKIAYAYDIYKGKKYNQCIQYCNNISNDPSLQVKKQVSMYQLLAKCFAKLKNTEKAVQYYYKCIELDSNSLENDYMGSIAAYLQSIKQYSKAMEFYNQAIDRLLPKYNKSEYCTERLRSLCETLYALYYEHKKYKQAYQIAELSAKLDFDNGKADQAYMIFGGAGVQKNEALGLGMLKKLAKEGNTEAASYLNDIAHSKK